MQADILEHVIRIIQVTPKERIDAFTAPQFYAQLESYLESGVNRYIIDLSDTPFLDSAGMAVLVRLLKRTRQMNGDVKLVWPKQEAAQRILRLTKFDRVFDISDSPQVALEGF